MTDPIHDALDGVLPPERLSAEERARAERLARVAAIAAAQLRAVPAPDLVRSVMARLPERAPARRGAVDALREALGWLWAPRPLRLTFRPAYAFAGAAFAAVAVAAWPDASAPGGGVPRAGYHGTPVVARPAPAAPPVYVQFRLEADGASRVALAGTFTGWQPRYEMTETAPGEWSVLVPMRPGVHDYAFVIDGERWIADPHAPQVDDDFGGTNSRISLPALASRS